MLVKIVRYTGKRESWWIFDNIKRITRSDRISKITGDANDAPHADLVIFDVEKTCTCGKGEGCSDCKDFIVLNCRMDNGDEFVIAFDTITYILNDNGKTIEKIVANYNN